MQHLRREFVTDLHPGALNSEQDTQSNTLLNICGGRVCKSNVEQVLVVPVKCNFNNVVLPFKVSHLLDVIDVCLLADFEAPQK